MLNARSVDFEYFTRRGRSTQYSYRTKYLALVLGVPVYDTVQAAYLTAGFLHMHTSRDVRQPHAAPTIQLRYS